MNYPTQQQYGQYGQGFSQDNDKIGDVVNVLVPAHHNGGVPIATGHVTQVHSHSSGNGPAWVNVRVTYNVRPGQHHRDTQEFLENIPLFDTEADLFAGEHISAGSRGGAHPYGAFYTEN